ncbi:MAG: ABC transporter ATP-binding protein [Deltaproteobacteria bacterium]|nr:ABC transporter ATP-binding protein [Deltaproteobacteria bacterium]
MSALLELRGVVKRFDLGLGELEVLHGVDLEIRRGELVAIMGPSGSGKTTLLEILGAISRPSRGEVALDGEAIQDWSDDRLADLRAQKLGFVFQTFNLMPRMSALRNAALPLVYTGVRREEREARARVLLERLGLGHRLEHRPAQMSGGERQRVAIARALVNEPALLFADEPTGNLDESTGREILEIFRELHAEGRTIVAVTHSEEVAAIAGRVVRLRDGRVESEARVDA